MVIMDYSGLLWVIPGYYGVSSHPIRVAVFVVDVLSSRRSEVKGHLTKN